MASSRGGSRLFRTWLLPLSILLGTALALFVLTFWVDAAGERRPSEVFALFFQPDPQVAMETLLNAAEVVAAVLSVAITVVAIIVELAANRYTHRITELFISEPVNFVVMGFFVLTALMCLWVTVTFDTAGSTGSVFVPYVGTGVALVMLTICLLTLLPYYAFVFAFVHPVQIVDRIRRHTIDVVRRRPARGRVADGQKEAVRGVEQLADVGLNSLEHKDKGVSMASVNALFAMARDYQDLRPNLPGAWFRVEGWLANNPDFVSMSPKVLESVSDRRNWFEMKVLRQYQTIYNEALNRMRDINYLIAINTRHLADSALEHDNPQLFDLVVKFFNTYLRATVNARDVRTAYNVLNQYRLLAEDVLDYDGGARSIEIARYFKYYGLTAYNVKLPFILETVAYDMCRLNELAFDRDSPAAPELLRIFLEVDKESETDVQEISLRGVRKAQVKLATHYLVHGNEQLARQVFRDMREEKAERLASIRDELLGVMSAEFWEISDRGINFDYLPLEQKEKLVEFFGWFGDRVPGPRASRVPSVPPGPPAGGSRRRRRPEPSLHDVPGAGPDPGSGDDEERSETVDGSKADVPV